MPRRPLVALVLAVAVLAPAALRAEPQRCRATITKAGAAYVQARQAALAKCGDGVLTGKLAPATDCTLEAKAAAAIAKADAKARALVAKACGGADRTCGAGGDDDALAAIGWDGGACPAGGACDDPIGHCGEIADCVVCAADAATAAMHGLAFDDLAPHGGDAALAKCQRTIVKATRTLVAARAKALAKCWSAVDKGNATGPCPLPGDAKAAPAIAKAETKLVTAVCKACGGADRGCDATVGGVPGTGGADDLPTAAIGFAATCPAVTVPAAPASCAGAVATLGDAVECLLCADAYEGQCVDHLATPWGVAYPGECVAEAEAEDCDPLLAAESFGVPDGGAWPSPWVALESIAAADVQGGRARLRPTLEPSYSLARMYAPFAAPASEVEVTFTFEFGDVTSQGIGFYLRQNGGHLQLTVPSGAGYAVFLEGYAVFGEGGGSQGIGVWKEVNGVEIPVSRVLLPAGTFQDGVRYRARFRVHQAGPATTQLRARAWPEGDPEPDTWDVEALDDEASLQSLAGGMAVDSWSRHNQGDPGPQGDTFVDDVEVRGLCNPLAGVLAPALVADAFGATPFEFTEGPRWRAAEGALLFTDLELGTIYRLAPPATVTEFRTGSNAANGLATDVNGDLLACEHATRRVTRTDGMGTITTVTGDFGGDLYHSPNDLAVRADGTIYFTDPQYGIGAHGQPVELGFNGLFRVAPGGGVFAEWMGGLADGPNGVVLSPDETRLYMSNTATGEVLAWDVNPDGSLASLATFASGLVTPDGLCMDAHGNLFVTAWGASAADGTIAVYAPDGDRWGAIPVGHSPTNCAFGGPDARTLYVTAHEGFMSGQAGLYATTVPLAGLY